MDIIESSSRPGGLRVCFYISSSLTALITSRYTDVDVLQSAASIGRRLIEHELSHIRTAFWVITVGSSSSVPAVCGGIRLFRSISCLAEDDPRRGRGSAEG